MNDDPDSKDIHTDNRTNDELIYDRLSLSEEKNYSLTSSDEMMWKKNKYMTKFKKVISSVYRELLYHEEKTEMYLYQTPNKSLKAKKNEEKSNKYFKYEHKKKKYFYDLLLNLIFIISFFIVNYLQLTIEMDNRIYNHLIRKIGFSELNTANLDKPETFTKSIIMNNRIEIYKYVKKLLYSLYGSNFVLDGKNYLCTNLRFTQRLYKVYESNAKLKDNQNFNKVFKNKELNFLKEISEFEYFNEAIEFNGKYFENLYYQTNNTFYDNGGYTISFFKGISNTTDNYYRYDMNNNINSTKLNDFYNFFKKIYLPYNSPSALLIIDGIFTNLESKIFTPFYVKFSFSKTNRIKAELILANINYSYYDFKHSSHILRFVFEIVSILSLIGLIIMFIYNIYNKYVIKCDLYNQLELIEIQMKLLNDISKNSKLKKRLKIEIHRKFINDKERNLNSFLKARTRKNTIINKKSFIISDLINDQEQTNSVKDNKDGIFIRSCKEIIMKYIDSYCFKNKTDSKIRYKLFLKLVFIDDFFLFFSLLFSIICLFLWVIFNFQLNKFWNTFENDNNNISNSKEVYLAVNVEKINLSYENIKTIYNCAYLYYLNKIFIILNVMVMPARFIIYYKHYFPFSEVLIKSIEMSINDIVAFFIIFFTLIFGIFLMISGIFYSINIEDTSDKIDFKSLFDNIFEISSISISEKAIILMEKGPRTIIIFFIAYLVIIIRLLFTKLLLAINIHFYNLCYNSFKMKEISLLAADESKSNESNIIKRFTITLQKLVNLSEKIMNIIFCTKFLTKNEGHKSNLLFNDNEDQNQTQTPNSRILVDLSYELINDNFEKDIESIDYLSFQNNNVRQMYKFRMNPYIYIHLKNESLLKEINLLLKENYEDNDNQSIIENIVKFNNIYDPDQIPYSNKVYINTFLKKERNDEISIGKNYQFLSKNKYDKKKFLLEIYNNLEEDQDVQINFNVKHYADLELKKMKSSNKLSNEEDENFKTASPFIDNNASKYFNFKKLPSKITHNNNNNNDNNYKNINLDKLNNNDYKNLNIDDFKKVSVYKKIEIEKGVLNNFKIKTGSNYNFQNVVIQFDEEEYYRPYLDYFHSDDKIRRIKIFFKEKYIKNVKICIWYFAVFIITIILALFVTESVNKFQNMKCIYNIIKNDFHINYSNERKFAIFNSNENDTQYINDYDIYFDDINNLKDLNNYVFKQLPLEFKFDRLFFSFKDKFILLDDNISISHRRLNKQKSVSSLLIRDMNNIRDWNNFNSTPYILETRTNNGNYKFQYNFSKIRSGLETGSYHYNFNLNMFYDKIYNKSNEVSKNDIYNKNYNKTKYLYSKLPENSNKDIIYFDELTKDVMIEFVLVNLEKELLTLVSLYFEIDEGGYVDKKIFFKVLGRILNKNYAIDLSMFIILNMILIIFCSYYVVNFVIYTLEQNELYSRWVDEKIEKDNHNLEANIIREKTGLEMLRRFNQIILNFNFLCDFIFIIVQIFSIIFEIIYFTKVWQLIDFTNIKYSSKDLYEVKTKMYEIHELNEKSVVLFSFLLILTSIRSLVIIDLGKYFKLTIKTLKGFVPSMTNIILFIGLIQPIFVLSGYYIYGVEINDYDSLTKSLFTTLQSLFGMYDINNFDYFNNNNGFYILSKIHFYAYIIIFNLLLLNMFQASLDLAYIEIKEIIKNHLELDWKSVLYSNNEEQISTEADENSLSNFFVYDKFLKFVFLDSKFSDCSLITNNVLYKDFEKNKKLKCRKFAEEENSNLLLLDDFLNKNFEFYYLNKVNMEYPVKNENSILYGQTFDLNDINISTYYFFFLHLILNVEISIENQILCIESVYNYTFSNCNNNYNQITESILIKKERALIEVNELEKLIIKEMDLLKEMNNIKVKLKTFEEDFENDYIMNKGNTKQYEENSNDDINSENSKSN